MHRFQYEGEFLDGKRHGKGVFTFANGKGTFEGDFAMGKAHGDGVFTWPDGASIKGHQWDGKFEGRVQFGWPDGKSSTAVVINDYNGIDTNDIF